MKIAFVQMSMGKEISENLDKSLKYCDMAKNCDLVFFPEIQLTPFFPQYHKVCVDHYCIDMNNDALVRLCRKAREHQYYLSPNVYLESEGARYDTSLWISPEGKIQDIAKMIHIAQNKNFYEQDYYTPAKDGFKVFAIPFGKIGIVICFDRHMPESIRTCARKGADLSSMIDKGETKNVKTIFQIRGDGKLEICQYSDGAGNVHSAIHDIPTEKSCGKAHRSCWVPMKVMWHFAENTIKKGNCGSEITSGSREEYDAPKPDKSKHLIWLFCNKSDRNKEYRQHP